MPEKTNKVKIVIIGAGNVATHLALRLKKKGHKIVQVLSRSEGNARLLALKTKAAYTTQLKKIDLSADVYLFCVPDDELEKLAVKLHLPGKLVLHTSGSVDMKVLKKIADKTGVLYPLQSFSKELKVTYARLPVLLEANTKESMWQLRILASSISKNLTEVNSTDRLKIHVAATFVNNFTNHLFALSDDFLKKEDSGAFQMLIPLIEQTFKKIKSSDPEKVQTGPARRGDVKTINKHLQVLKNYPEQKKVYELFTHLIKQKYHG